IRRGRRVAEEQVAERRGALPYRLPFLRACGARGARGGDLAARGAGFSRPRKAGARCAQQAGPAARPGMNLLLLRDEDFAPDGTARLSGRRLLHAREVLRASEGDSLRVGKLGGLIGRGEVIRLDERELVLRIELTEAPPSRPGVDLLLALPRPKALRKVLSAVASLGVDRIVLVNAARVEKSYFDSK